MSELKDFEIIQDYAVFRPVGQVSLEQAVQLVKSAITKTSESRIHKLLIDITGLTGFDPPSVTTRYFLIHEWAQAAGGVVRVAVMAPKEMIDCEKFGVTVAGNIGLIADIFVSEGEALTSMIGKRIVMLHQFVKKTKKTPPNELAIARRRMKEVKNAYSSRT